MQIIPGAFIDGLRGKECMHSKSYARQNRVTGKVNSGKMCNPSTAEPTAEMLAARAAFKTLVQGVRAFIADPVNATEVAKLKAAYRSQTSIGSFFGYVVKEVKKGNVTIA